MRLDFVALHARSPGTIAALLAESYAGLLRSLPEKAGIDLRRTWEAYDTEVHDAPDTVGRCGFLTIAGDEIVGMASWDPRGWPDVGRVGHNCVRPVRQGQGFGRLQIERVLTHFREKSFAAAEARTGTHPFYEPARRMYARCGFTIVAHESRRSGSGHGTLLLRAALVSAFTI
jgi:GNAT superfamily N-acetyltransferase